MFLLKIILKLLLCFMADRCYGGTIFTSEESIVVHVNETKFDANLD